MALPQQQIIELKKQLITEISSWIDNSGLRQVDVANLLNVSRPRISDLVNYKVNKFTIDTLVAMVAKLEGTVNFNISIDF